MTTLRNGVFFPYASDSISDPSSVHPAPARGLPVTMQEIIDHQRETQAIRWPCCGRPLEYDAAGKEIICSCYDEVQNRAQAEFDRIYRGMDLERVR